MMTKENRNGVTMTTGPCVWWPSDAFQVVVTIGTSVPCTCSRHTNQCPWGVLTWFPAKPTLFFHCLNNCVKLDVKVHQSGSSHQHGISVSITKDQASSAPEAGSEQLEMGASLFTYICCLQYRYSKENRDRSNKTTVAMPLAA